MAGLDDTIAKGCDMAARAAAGARAVRGAASVMAGAFVESAPKVQAAYTAGLRAGDRVPDTRAEEGFGRAAAAVRDYLDTGQSSPLIEAQAMAEAAAESLVNGVSAVEADPVLEDALEAAENLAGAIRAYLSEVAELRRIEGPAGELAAELRGE